MLPTPPWSPPPQLSYAQACRPHHAWPPPAATPRAATNAVDPKLRTKAADLARVAARPAVTSSSPAPEPPAVAAAARMAGHSFVDHAKQSGRAGLRRAVFVELEARLRRDAPQTCRDLAAALAAVGYTGDGLERALALLVQLVAQPKLAQALQLEQVVSQAKPCRSLADELQQACAFLTLGDVALLGFLGGQKRRDPWQRQLQRLGLARVLPHRWGVATPPLFAVSAAGSWLRPTAVATVLLAAAATEEGERAGPDLQAWLCGLRPTHGLVAPLLEAARVTLSNF